MGNPIVQIPSIVLPQVWVTGNEVETLNDLVAHASIDIPMGEHFQEKEIHITATEVVGVGVPGNLLCWIELSPVASTVSTAFWAAIGGGGGALAPLAPLIEVAIAANGTIHGILLPWAIHSPWARLVVQVPVAATPLTDHWTLQAQFSAKGP